MTDKTLTLVERLEEAAEWRNAIKRGITEQTAALLREAATALRSMPDREAVIEECATLPNVPSNWRPIAEAPRDGTSILACHAGGNSVWKIRWGLDGKWGMSGYPIFWEPTHWQPLPSPPTAEGERESISRGEANTNLE